MQVALIGAGNVATHLGKAWKQAGHQIIQVYSRHVETARLLADEVGAEAITDIHKLSPEAALYVCAVRDDALESLLPLFPPHNGLLVHTSGSLPMDILSPFSARYGVLYPLQTFSKSRELVLRSVPFFMEASDPESEEQLRRLACDLSDRVIKLESERRKYLHLAAVFACNFVNYLYDVSSELLKSKGMPFSWLYPLIEETAAKVQDMSPYEAQTGPAVRQDSQVMNQQLKCLSGHEEWTVLYELLSSQVANRHSTNLPDCQEKQNN
jgi:predicted short-subunit dehydrogenase-like oxidoreductase (DUF2520 family)